MSKKKRVELPQPKMPSVLVHAGGGMMAGAAAAVVAVVAYNAGSPKDGVVDYTDPNRTSMVVPSYEESGDGRDLPQAVQTVEEQPELVFSPEQPLTLPASAIVDGEKATKPGVVVERRITKIEKAPLTARLLAKLPGHGSNHIPIVPAGAAGALIVGAAGAGVGVARRRGAQQQHDDDEEKANEVVAAERHHAAEFIAGQHRRKLASGDGHAHAVEESRGAGGEEKGRAAGA